MSCTDKTIKQEWQEELRQLNKDYVELLSNPVFIDEELKAFSIYISEFEKVLDYLTDYGDNNGYN